MSFVKEILFQKLALTYIDSIWNITADRVPLLVILSGSNCSRIIIRAILKIMMVAVDYEINVCIRILAWRNMRHSSNKHLEKKLGQMINYLLCQIFHLGYSWGIFWLVSWSTANHRFTAGNLEYIYNSILGYEGNYILRLKRKPVRVYDKTVSCSNLSFTSALGSFCSLTNVKLAINAIFTDVESSFLNVRLFGCPSRYKLVMPLQGKYIWLTKVLLSLFKIMHHSIKKTFFNLLKIK